MTILVAFPISLLACVAGVGVFLILRFLRPGNRSASRLVAVTTLCQFVLTLVGLSILPWHDGASYDEYRGPFFLIGSFVAFTLFHAACLLARLVRRKRPLVGLALEAKP